MFLVTTDSGLKMILEDAGRDADGNQLWRQVKIDDIPSGSQTYETGLRPRITVKPRP